MQDQEKTSAADTTNGTQSRSKPATNSEILAAIKQRLGHQKRHREPMRLPSSREKLRTRIRDIYEEVAVPLQQGRSSSLNEQKARHLAAVKQKESIRLVSVLLAAGMEAKRLDRWAESR